MKKHLFTILLICITISLFGQTKSNYVGINKQYNKTDTTRTFNLVKNSNYDSFRDKFVKFWGTPLLNETGNIKWTNINIEKIGSDMTIALTDGICTKKPGCLSCDTFKSNDDKIKKLKNLKSNQYRDIEIIITTKDGKNIINDKAKTEIIVSLIESIVK